MLFFIWITIHHSLKTKYDLIHNEPKGDIINYNGFDIHIYENLHEIPKSSIIILSDNLTCSPYGEMHKLSNTLFENYDVMIYEKPGHGWSEVTTSERTVSNMVSELHFSLSNSRLYPPYTIVAQSTAILDAIHYAQLYPENVQAIISIQGDSPNFYETASEPSSISLSLKSISRQLGIIRFMTYIKGLTKKFAIPKNLDNEDLNICKMFISKNYYNNNIVEEEKNLIENSQIVIDNGKIGNIPINILISKSPNSSDFTVTHKEFKNFSNNVTLKLISNCDYYIHHNACKLITNEINSLMKL